ncbi:unnamed protein product, partial [Mesorhabditis belari]|uniref:Protein kinase domain-containing protein n=1 Tax=Mesorhabditis belari TaxID=2138241 RepID=A0AAF3EMV9_9BILA
MSMNWLDIIPVRKIVHCGTKAQQDAFKKEYETLQEMEHPNIVEFLRTEQLDDDRFGIVMEYCRLGDLKKVILDSSVIYTMNTVVCWGEQLFGAVDYIPPQLDETQDPWEQRKTQQDSHRNDVYSLGLTMWEIIERRNVFSEYGNRCFDRNGFLDDIILKRFKELSRPECQDKLGEIVQKCTNFNRSLRPNAQEVVKSLENFRKPRLRHLYRRIRRW